MPQLVPVHQKGGWRVVERVLPSARPKPESLASLIFLIRGDKVLLDADLALLYGVCVRALNQAVSRNRERFPADFMFQLSDEEFDEQGVAMLSSVLRSPEAVEVTIASEAMEKLDDEQFNQDGVSALFPKASRLRAGLWALGFR